ncbi:hypothetical protein CAEBREN_08635 [Caenorhabditis brenneri]|uniref:F-box associated domain-containing protein n=1 Tax=Caenorhabditis brenneri TaxID=135651 RepID=G0NFW1_CAEBE|nr:hypothetical protein CAEBREN_08635 [Caenorhabditis brenneri]
MNQSTKSIVEDTVIVYNEIEQLFRIEIPFLLVFSTGYKTITTVKEVLSDPILRTWKHCIFEEKQISSEELKMILDMASSDRSFASIAKEGPKELRHEKALKFENNIHRDARWVKTEDLYKLNNGGTVTLGKNNFTQSDIKAFISYWVNSDIDMFWRLEIQTYFETVDIVDGLTVLHFENSTTVFTKAKSSETRKKTLLFLYRSLSGFLTLTAWAPDEFTYTRGELDTMVRNKHGVIDLLIEKRQLDAEEQSADRENKRRIRSRLTQLDDEIRDYGVFYDNRRATLRVPTQ